MRGLSLVAIALATPSLAAAVERPLLLPSQPLQPEVEREAARRGLEVAHPRREPDVAAESGIADARPLYGSMAFGRAVAKLQAAESALIEGRLPSERLAASLAPLEIWMGACLLLDNKPADAGERFALGKALAPSARPDRIFPPEVAAAFARAQPGARVTPKIELSPPGARLWLDGKPAAASPTTTAGLHWIVVERADRRPLARVGRVTQAAPEIAASLDEAAAPGDALRQAAARAQSASDATNETALGADEGIAVSTALGRTLWIVGAHGADRYAATDIAQPTRHVELGVTPIESLCAAEPACVTPPPPRKPIYRRAALWVPLAAGVVLAVGAGVLAGELANSSSDYVVRVR
jgi:hypothetical protein